MPAGFNNQDPRTTGIGDNAGVYGADKGGDDLRSGARRTQEKLQADEQIDRDVENLAEAMERHPDFKGTRRSTPNE